MLEWSVGIPLVLVHAAAVADSCGDTWPGSICAWFRSSSGFGAAFVRGTVHSTFYLETRELRGHRQRYGGNRSLESGVPKRRKLGIRGAAVGLPPPRTQIMDSKGDRLGVSLKYGYQGTYTRGIGVDGPKPRRAAPVACAETLACLLNDSEFRGKICRAWRGEIANAGAGMRSFAQAGGLDEFRPLSRSDEPDAGPRSSTSTVVPRIPIRGLLLLHQALKF